MLTEKRQGQLTEKLQLSLKKKSIVSFFRQAAAAASDEVAYQDGDKKLTYRDLDKISDNIAGSLTQEGVEKGDRVALFGEPTPMIIATIIGIIKSGGVVVPLDPLTLKKHIASAVEETRPKFVIAESPGAPSYLSEDRISFTVQELLQGLDAPQDISLEPGDSPALVFVQKGATLKGVELTHQAIANLSCWNAEVYHYTPGKNFAIGSRFRCDSFLPELLSALCQGVTVKRIPCSHVQNSGALKQWIFDEAIDWMSLPISAAEELLDEPWGKTAPLQTLFVGSGRLKKPPACDLPFKVVNTYGHPESGAVSTEYEVTADEESLVIPIGHPISNVKAYVLSPTFQDVAHGECGQLCLGGIGLARGYVDDTLNHTQFVIQTRVGKRPERLFLTGDLVRKRNDGKLEFLGSIEEQEAIGDSEVGLTALESIISSQLGVLHAHVKPVVIGEEIALAAYWVNKKQGAAAASQLKRALKRRVPPHMIPKYWIPLAQFPIGIDGRVCRTELPIPKTEEEEVEERDPPTNPVEKKLAALWETVFKIPFKGIHKSFYTLEVDEGALTVLRDAIKRQFGKDIPLVSLYSCDTIAKQAERLTQSKQDFLSPITALCTEGNGPPLICFYGYTETPFSYFLTSRNLKAPIPMYALNVTDGEATIETLAEKAADAIKKEFPSGPYRFLGEGIGGYVAYEAAKKLKNEVAFLGIVQTEAPYGGNRPPFFNRMKVNMNEFLHLSAEEKKEVVVKKLQKFESSTGELFGFRQKNDSKGDLRLNKSWWHQKSAMRHYRPKAQDREIAVFSFIGNGQTRADHSLGWNQLSNKLKIEKVPGKRKELHTKSVAKSFAMRLLKQFDETADPR